MGVDPLTLLSMMGSMGANTGSMALGAVPLVTSLIDRYRTSSDPLVNMTGYNALRQYNQALGGMNPYGDALGGWGGMFGQRSDGSNVGVGEANAYALMNMLNQSPSTAALQNYQQLSGYQAPQLADATSGMSNLLGRPSQFQGTGNQSPSFTPQAPTVETGTNFSGAAPQNSQYSPLSVYGGGYNLPPSLASNLPIGNIAQSVLRQAPGMAGMLYRGANAIAPNLVGGLLGARENTRGPVENLLGIDFPPMVQNAISRLQQRNQNRGSGKMGPQPAVMPQPATGRNRYGGNTGMLSVMPKAASTGMPAANASGGQLPTQTASAPPPMLNAAPGAAQGPSAAFSQPNLYQQVLGNPMSLTPQVQQQIYQRGKQNIDAESAALGRSAREGLAQQGMLNSGVGANRMMELQQNRLGALSNLNRDIGIEAARTNFGDLMNSAGMQLGAEQALGNLALQQNAQQQGQFQQGFQNQGNIIDRMNQAGMQGQQNQLGLWSQLQQLANLSRQYPQQYLNQALALRQYQLQPTGVQSGPMYVGTTQNPAAYSGGGGGGGSSSGDLWSALGAAAGMWAGNGFPTPWGN